MTSSGNAREAWDPLSVSESKDFFRCTAGGVAVITSRGAAGPVGLTVSTVTSLSVEPPLLLACVASGSETLAAIESRRAFAVHLLRADQEWLSAAFSRGSSRDKFERASPRAFADLPLFDDCLAWALCSLFRLHVAGDHTILIGAVQRTRCAGGEPLLWHGSAYRQLAACAERGSTSAHGEGAR